MCALSDVSVSVQHVDSVVQLALLSESTRLFTMLFFLLFSLQNDESPSVGFKLQVGELKDMKILNSLRRPGDIDRIFLETKKNRVQES